MSQDKYRKALENCSADALKLRKKMKELEEEIKDTQATADKIKRALQNCTADALKLRKKMKSPEMRIRRKSRRSKRSRR